MESKSPTENKNLSTRSHASSADNSTTVALRASLNNLWDVIVREYQREFGRSISHPSVVEACFRLWEQLNAEHDRELPSSYLSSPPSAGAYILLFWIPNIIRCASALSMGGPVTFHENETWWDLGCGPFSATLAQLLLRGNRGGRVQIIGVDRAIRVPKFAVKVLEQGFGGADINWKFVKGDLTTFIPRADKSSFHRAFITHALNESRSPDRFVKQLNAICHRIDAQTVFFLEPAKKEPFERLARVRDLFIDHEFSVLAPCTHNAACPMLGRPKDWCHFSTPLFEKLQWSRFSEQFFKGKTARNLNFSFVYLSREQKPRAGAPLRIVTDVLRGRQGSFSYGCGVDGLIATQERGRGRLVDGP